MSLDWNDRLVEQLEWHWRTHLRPRLQGLDDEEYRWEPVAGCWNLRPRGEATSSKAAGKGESTDWPATATGGLALLDQSYDAWMSGVRALDVRRPGAPHQPGGDPPRRRGRPPARPVPRPRRRPAGGPAVT